MVSVLVDTGEGNVNVDIPEGYVRVGPRSECKPGDMFYNLGTGRFTYADHEDWGDPPWQFALLIRRG